MSHRKQLDRRVILSHGEPSDPEQPRRRSTTKLGSSRKVRSYGDVDVEYDESDIEYDDSMAIVLMGVTGSGKSSFVSLLTDEPAEVGHSLQSCTTETVPYDIVQDNGTVVHLIDTPGFDDTTKSNIEVLKEVAVMLNIIYKEKIPLAGIIYLHRITDVRLSGSAMKSLQVLQSICGEGAYPGVVLATTMWGIIDKKPGGFELGVERERELMENDGFWGNMRRQRSHIMRHDGSVDSAKNIINTLVSRRKNVVLQLQREMVDEGKTLDQTSAGLFLRQELLAVRRRHEEQLEQLRQELQEARDDKDEDMVSILSEHLHERERLLEESDPQSAGMHFNHQQLTEQRVIQRGGDVMEIQAEVLRQRAEFEEAKREISDLRRQLRRSQVNQGENDDLEETLRRQEDRLEADRRYLEAAQHQQQQQSYEIQRYEQDRRRYEIEGELLDKEEELRQLKKKLQPINLIKSLFWFAAPQAAEQLTRQVLPRDRRLPYGGLSMRSTH